jgi:glycosyltransferase involved in cell wall biosynthesis
MLDEIRIKRAAQHNLKHIDVALPRNKLIVVTGPSGSGKSSLAFDTFASLHDIVEDGVNGLVIPPDDLGAYARCLMGLMADRNRREEMAMNGVQSCRRYSVDVIAKQWVDLFEAVLSEGRPPR